MADNKPGLQVRPVTSFLGIARLACLTTLGAAIGSAAGPGGTIAGALVGGSLAVTSYNKPKSMGEQITDTMGKTATGAKNAVADTLGGVKNAVGSTLGGAKNAVSSAKETLTPGEISPETAQGTGKEPVASDKFNDVLKELKTASPKKDMSAKDMLKEVKGTCKTAAKAMGGNPVAIKELAGKAKAMSASGMKSGGAVPDGKPVSPGCAADASSVGGKEANAAGRGG